MNVSEQTTKIIIGAVLGAAAGLFVGSVVAEVMRQRDELNNFGLLEETDEEEEEVLDESKETKKGNNKVAKQVDYTQLFKNRPELEELINKYNFDRVGVDPEKELVEEEDEEPMTEEEEWIEDEFEKIADVYDDSTDEEDTDDIAIISAEEYHKPVEGWAKVVLHYYDDDVLTLHNGQGITKPPESFLGEEALESFGDMSGDDDIVYVRNRLKNAMYEIVHQRRVFWEDETKRPKRAKDEREEL